MHKINVMSSHRIKNFNVIICLEYEYQVVMYANHIMYAKLITRFV